MNKNNIEQILELLSDRLELLGVPLEEVNVEQSLFEQGILDSISFLEFMIDLETKFNIELDLSELDPTEFNSIEKLNDLIND